MKKCDFYVNQLPDGNCKYSYPQSFYCEDAVVAFRKYMIEEVKSRNRNTSTKNININKRKRR